MTAWHFTTQGHQARLMRTLVHQRLHHLTHPPLHDTMMLKQCTHTPHVVKAKGDTQRSTHSCPSSYAHPFLLMPLPPFPCSPLMLSYPPFLTPVSRAQGSSFTLSQAHLCNSFAPHTIISLPHVPCTLYIPPSCPYTLLVPPCLSCPRPSMLLILRISLFNVPTLRSPSCLLLPTVSPFPSSPPLTSSP